MSYLFERKEEQEQKEQPSKKTKQENPNRALTLGMGKIMFDASFERAKKRGVVSEKERFMPLNCEIGDLHEQQTALDRQRADIAKRFTHFRDAEKETLKKLEPFKGDEREVLMRALGKRLLPQDPKTKKTEADKAREKKEDVAEQKVLEKLDEQMGLDAAMPPEKQTEIYLSCFTVLKQESIFKTEDQLNGTREQELDRTYELLDAVSEVTALLSEHPSLQSACSMILGDKDMSDFEKAYALSAIADSFEKPKAKNPLKKYFHAAGTENDARRELEEKMHLLERRKRYSKEEISRARENVMSREGGAQHEKT